MNFTSNNCRSKIYWKKIFRFPNGVSGSVSKSPKRPFWGSRTDFFFRGNSTLRYECDATFSNECEFAARAEGEWCNHTFISRGVKMRISAREACVKPHLRTRSDIKKVNCIVFRCEIWRRLLSCCNRSNIKSWLLFSKCSFASENTPVKKSTYTTILIGFKKNFSLFSTGPLRRG